MGLLDSFKDVKDNILLDEDDIVVKEEEEKVVDEGQGAMEQGDDACV